MPLDRVACLLERLAGEGVEIVVESVADRVAVRPPCARSDELEPRKGLVQCLLPAEDGHAVRQPGVVGATERVCEIALAPGEASRDPRANASAFVISQVAALRDQAPIGVMARLQPGPCRSFVQPCFRYDSRHRQTPKNVPNKSRINGPGRGWTREKNVPNTVCRVKYP